MVKLCWKVLSSCGGVCFIYCFEVFPAKLKPSKTDIYHFKPSYSLFQGRRTKQKGQNVQGHGCQATVRIPQWPTNEVQITRLLSDVARSHLWVVLADGNSTSGKLVQEMFTSVEARLSEMVIKSWQRGNRRRGGGSSGLIPPM